MGLPVLRIALVGNPNAGKSTLFNALSGLRQHIANYPGVTVELKHGKFQHQGQECVVVDLPGTYSLAARSPDEFVAVEFLLGLRPEEPGPDRLVAVVDATNLDRHLFLTSQLFDLGLPVIIALTMTDVARARGITIDVAALSAGLGCPVIPLEVPRGVGLEALKDAVIAAQPAIPTPTPFPDSLTTALQELQPSLPTETPAVLARRLLWDEGSETEKRFLARPGIDLASFRQSLSRARHTLKAQHGPAFEAMTRYAWIRSRTQRSVRQPVLRVTTVSDRLDRILTHRVWGTMFFLALMFVVFQSIFVWATPLMDLIDGWFASLSGFVEGKMAPGPLRSLLTEGIIAGVGGVLVFLPQIMILFGFIAILEDCGYMARAAYLMDRLMRRCGLNGKSFIPLLSSTACAVPGILATRVIEQPRDRLATILVAPLMSCSARLPVYSLFIGAFFRDGYPWWVPGSLLFAMYLIGFIVAPLVAFALKRTLLRGENPSFLLELPNFKRPSLVAILRRMWDAGQAFVVRAGTMILASMILIWAALYFPYVSEDGRNFPEQLQTIAEDREALATANSASKADPARPGTPTDGETKLAALEELQARVQGEWKRQSYLGRLGLAMEPVFTPLGWDWKLGVAALASFPAREVMVGVFGMLYDRGEVDPGTLEDPEDESGQSLKSAVREQWQADPERGRFSAASALSIMVFFALCCQCVSTLAVIRRETRSWRWPIFTFVYMTLLAYLAAGVTYQVGVWYLS